MGTGVGTGVGESLNSYLGESINALTGILHLGGFAVAVATDDHGLFNEGSLALFSIGDWSLC